MCISVLNSHAVNDKIFKKLEDFTTASNAAFDKIGVLWYCFVLYCPILFIWSSPASVKMEKSRFFLKKNNHFKFKGALEN
jgi:hypothetical protein